MTNQLLGTEVNEPKYGGPWGPGLQRSTQMGFVVIPAFHLKKDEHFGYFSSS